MTKERFIIDAADADLDLAELGINHKEPDHDDIRQLLWGVPNDMTIPFEEFDGATLGERVDG